MTTSSQNCGFHDCCTQQTLASRSLFLASTAKQAEASAFATTTNLNCMTCLKAAAVVVETVAAAPAWEAVAVVAVVVDC